MTTEIDEIQQVNAGENGRHNADYYLKAKRNDDSQNEHPEELSDHPEHVSFANPLRNLDQNEVARRARIFWRLHGLRAYVDKGMFVRAALAAADPNGLDDIRGLTRLEKQSLVEGDLSFWCQIKNLTKDFKLILATGCIAAIVQGWDQSSINGANLYWPKDLGLDHNLSNPYSGDAWIFGMVNAATYLSAAIVGAQLSDPLNEHFFGRRGALLTAALFSFATVIGAANANSWQMLLVMRILLGIGIGAKASVVPIYIAETAPRKLRGSLIICWQIFVACGIFLGNAANLVVFDSWRKQVASPFIPAIPLIILVPLCYESPRWLYKHDRIKQALDSLRHIRKSEIIACKDLFLMHEQLQGEIKFFMRRPNEEAPPSSQPFEAENSGDDRDEDKDEEEMEQQPQERALTWRERLKELRSLLMSRRAKAVSQYQLEIRRISYFQRLGQLFVRPHVRATTAATCVMAAQQLCGINVLAFLSTTVFNYAMADASGVDPEMDEEQELQVGKKVLWMSFGFGVSQFIFSWLAWGTIDRRGRRWLLNWSFPNMAWSLIAMGFCFKIKSSDLRLGWIVFFSVTFSLAYSLGVGPVPFTASAEMFPLFIREVGMSFAVFVNLLGAGILALVVPSLVRALSPTGMLCLFAGLDLVAWLLCYLFYPETARISLEELRAVFEVPLKMQARYRMMRLRYLWQYYVRRWDVDEPEPIDHWYKSYLKAQEEIQRRRMRLDRESDARSSTVSEIDRGEIGTDPENERLRRELGSVLREIEELKREVEDIERMARDGLAGASSTTMVPERGRESRD